MRCKSWMKQKQKTKNCRWCESWMKWKWKTENEMQKKAIQKLTTSASSTAFANAFSSSSSPDHVLSSPFVAVPTGRDVSWAFVVGAAFSGNTAASHGSTSICSINDVCGAVAVVVVVVVGSGRIGADCGVVPCTTVVKPAVLSVGKSSSPCSSSKMSLSYTGASWQTRETWVKWKWKRLCEVFWVTLIALFLLADECLQMWK